MSDIRIDLPWSSPPLSANQRMHWAPKARTVQEVRRTTWALARNAKPPKADRLIITLHYRPKDRRRRDAHNLYPLVKACVDGIVDAGVVPDDDTDHVSTPEPVIHPPNRQPAMWLEIHYPNGEPA